ncbi:MAG: LysM peptidoglycan-binding domain-containing protein [bacterium]|nr:LysM peptidoglycan-binding domain-containing protein [bacterium]
MKPYTDIPFRPSVYTLALMLLLTVLVGGCASVLPGGNSVPEPPPQHEVADTVVPDTVEIVVDAPEPVQELPPGPGGTVPLRVLEDLLAESLRLAGEGSTGLAEDGLALLMEAVERPVPAATDSLYLVHRDGVARRTRLLAAILAEHTAAAADPVHRDSALAAEYGRLVRIGFPDSLVPATGFTLPAITADLLKIDNAAVRRWENYYQGRGRRTFQLWLERKAAVDSVVTSILVEAGLPVELIYLSAVESGFSTRAVSSAAAVGPWQFVAGTAKTYGLRMNWWVDERRDIELSTRAAAAYLVDLHRQFGDWALVLAAYNTGAGRVSRRIRQHGHDNFWSLRLPAETTAHIPKFIAAARIGADPAAYDFVVPEMTPLAYDVVRARDATDLVLVAECAGVDPSLVQDLNPALLRGASPPDVGPYPVRVPRGTGDRATSRLSRVPLDKRLTWRRHQVRRGETLSGIAERWGTSVRDIAALNGRADVHVIHPGDQLLIPIPADLADKARRHAAEKGHYVPPAGYQRVSYKVKSGDTLGRVAQSLGVTVTHLRKVNNIHGTNLIHPGQRLYAYRPGG